MSMITYPSRDRPVLSSPRYSSSISTRPVTNMADPADFFPDMKSASSTKRRPSTGSYQYESDEDLSWYSATTSTGPAPLSPGRIRGSTSRRERRDLDLDHHDRIPRRSLTVRDSGSSSRSPPKSVHFEVSPTLSPVSTRKSSSKSHHRSSSSSHRHSSSSSRDILPPSPRPRPAADLEWSSDEYESSTASSSASAPREKMATQLDYAVRYMAASRAGTRKSLTYR